MPSQTARKKFPAQLVIVTTDEVAGRIRREAEEDGVSIAEVARHYLELGMAKADDDAGDPLPWLEADGSRYASQEAYHTGQPRTFAPRPAAELADPSKVAYRAEGPTTRPAFIPSKGAITI